MTDPHEEFFPEGFFRRMDASDDGSFYAQPRLVTHIDDTAIAAVGELYAELEIDGDVLDLMSSWISHFAEPPASLTVLGMNEAELDANPMATQRVVHDLNIDPVLPFPDDSFDDAVCCVSVDYLVRPLDVFAEVARVLRPGGRFVCTFSNRCFPTKAIAGWTSTDDRGHVSIVAEYFRHTESFGELTLEVPIEPGAGSDPLFAVYGAVHSAIEDAQELGVEE